MEFFTYIFLAIVPLFGLLKPNRSAKLLTSMIGLAGTGFICLTVWVATKGSLPITGYGFRVQSLGLLLSLFILFVSGIIHLFSIRYMAGDRKIDSFFRKLSVLTTSLLLLVGADHLLLLLTFWVSSNLLLGSLMIHKSEWKAAKNGGLLMLKSSLIGSVFLLVASLLLSFKCHSFSLYEITQSTSISHPVKLFASVCLIFAALAQSGVWPFHRWLLSSLNSPTPVSGLMHAGLVNGGGVLLTRFAPLILQEPFVLDLLFLLGLISVVLGTGWKLVQSNIKSMLACSTIAQMGFLLMQCGLGLFPAAIAHLFWHGLFKCFLFLNSGSAVQEKRDGISLAKNLWRYPIAIALGLGGAYSFSRLQENFVLIAFAWLAATQIAYTLIKTGRLFVQAPFALLAAIVFGFLYGFTVHFMEGLVVTASQQTVLHPLHIGGTVLILLLSLAVNTQLFSSKRLYVEMVNGSRNHFETKTLSRTEYNY